MQIPGHPTPMRSIISMISDHRAGVNRQPAAGYVRDSVSGEEGGTPTCDCQDTNGAPPMSQRAATITSLPMAFEVVKAMQGEGLEWGEGYRPLGRQALAEIIEDQMAAAVDRHLEQL